MKKILLFIVVVSLIIPSLSYAKRKPKYKAIEVTNGGTIKGTIKSAKKVKDPVIPIKIKPKENPAETKLEKDTCGSSQQAMMYVLSSSNGVKNALVLVENVKEGKAAPKKDLTINNLKCRFEPLVGIAYVKSNYIIKNSDPLLHNTNLGKEQRAGVRRTVYNLALPFKDQVIKKLNRVAGLINVKCDAHPWMRSYIYSSRHPYVAITDADGGFEIKDLPPGKYKVRVWHEGFEDVVKEVEVKAGGTSELKATFAKTRTPDIMK
ncbi:MAG: carboxypeptidase regulatory-like domain-containing protein [Nitrospirota bacterium]